jgi:hypothetical protein
MLKKPPVRIINFKIAEEERIEFSMKMSPDQRISYLQHLREINLGRIAKQPIKKIISIII